MLWHKNQGAGGGGGGDATVSDSRILYLNAAESASYSGTGTDWFDLSPEGNNGVLTNGPFFNPTFSYFTFDGDDDYVELGTITTSNKLQLSSPSGNGMSFMFALNWAGRNTDAFQRIIDKSDGGFAANGWGIWFSSDNNLSLNIDGGGSTTAGIGFVPDNQWVILAITLDLLTKEVVYYQNGNFYSSTTDPNAAAAPNIEKNARIATWNHSTGREFKGDLGFIMVYEKPLSSAEITQNYDALKGLYGLT